MTKRPARSLLFLTFVFSFSILAAAQSKVASYSLPQAISLERIVRKTFPDYYGREEYHKLEVDGFFPIGWSRDGKFAYYVEPVDEACGCYFVELLIQDLRTDTILWKFKNDPESRVDKDGAPLEDDIRRLWKRNQKLFDAKLNEYGIVPMAHFSLLPRSFSSAGKTYTAKINAAKSNDEDGLNRVKTVSLDFRSPTLGKKTLYSADYRGDMFTSPLDVAVAGAFKSPYENRAAIIIINVQRGWEGPPHTVDVKIVGADLKNGFDKIHTQIPAARSR
ncbi:MAG TPA: hypothetical protein VGQ55_11190 [Pyrinomonadaceae bacterium]|nr:hypothetical protein [Pyrinomonadaceae bacterium]